MEARNKVEILGAHGTDLGMAIPAQPVEVGPGQAIRLYACKALGAAGPYARCWPVFTAILIAKKTGLVTTTCTCSLLLSSLQGLSHYILQKHCH